MPLVKVKLSSLIEDFDLYPRHAVDTSHVSRLAEAIRAGTELPPVIFEKKTGRLVDGFHRTRAWRKVLGTGGEIKADGRTYDTEQALLREAVELNAGHGRKLDQQDYSRAALLLERHGVPVAEISTVLHVTETKVRQLLDVRVVLVRPKGGGDAEKRPGKPVAYRAPGPVGDDAPDESEGPREITEEQYEVMRSSYGWRTGQVVTQLVRELESGLVDLSNAELRGKLIGLRDTISKLVPEAA